jgi:hypothetical protein
MNKQQYLWVHKKNSTEEILRIVDNPIELYNSGKVNPTYDAFYEIGKEVMIKVSLEPRPGLHFRIDDTSKIQRSQTFGEAYKDYKLINESEPVVEV